MPTSTELKGFASIGDDTYSDILRANIVSFIDWGLINKGGFFNVTIPSSGIYGGTGKHVLRLIEEQRYQNGRVWQAFRGNWVWQSGLSTPIQPIQVSGVYVNGSFYPLNTSGTYAHYVDYPRGRIVFDNPIPSSASVQAEYSYKWVNVVDARDYTFLKTAQIESLNTSNPSFNMIGSGDYDRPIDSRLQLPLITVEISKRTTLKGYELGNGSYCWKNVICEIYGENDRNANKLSDILTFQKEKTIHLYDTNAISRQRRFPLDVRGSINSGALTYPQLVAPSSQGGFMLQNHCTGTLYFKDAESNDGGWLNQNLYYSIVKYQTESILSIV